MEFCGCGSDFIITQKSKIVKQQSIITQCHQFRRLSENFVSCRLNAGTLYILDVIQITYAIIERSPRDKAV